MRAKELEGLIGVSRGERVWTQALVKMKPTIAARPQVEAHLVAAIKAFDKGGALLEIAHTYLIWGEICQDWGDPETAQVYYAHAAAQYQQSQLTPMLEKVRQRQHIIG